MTNQDGSEPTTGQGTEAETDAMAEARARRLGNLRPPFKKGEVANPTGRNGRDKPNEIAKFLDQPESVESNRTRFEAIVDRLFRLALRGDTLAAKVLVEYKLGKPRTPPNELDLAEHMRKVARDGANLALRVLGSRIHSMPPKELAEFFLSCAGDTEAFLAAAELQRQANDSQPAEQLAPAPTQDEEKPAKQAKRLEEEPDEEPGKAGSPWEAL